MSSYYPPEGRSGDAHYNRRPGEHHDPPPRHNRDRYPPADDYPASDYPPSQRDYDSYDAPPPPRRAEYDRGVPSDPTLPESNALTPYNEEKAYAEWERGYGQEQRYDREPLPPTDYDRRPERRQRPVDRDPRYDDRYDDRDSDRDYDRAYDTRPRRHRETSPPRHESKERERDLTATLLAGAGGALLGRKVVGGGALGTIGGAVAGALGANAVEKYEEKKKQRRESVDLRDRSRRDYEDERYSPVPSSKRPSAYDDRYAPSPPRGQRYPRDY